MIFVYFTIGEKMMKQFICLCLFVFSLGFSQVSFAQRISCPPVNKDPELNKSEARRYFQMGSTFVKTNEHTKSIRSFECVLKLVPYSMMARLQLAKSYDALEQYSKALVHYRWVIAEGSADSESLKPEIEKRIAEIEPLPDRALTPEEIDQLSEPKEVVIPRDPVKVPHQPKSPPKPTWLETLTTEWWFWTGAGATVLFTGLTIYGGISSMQLNDKWEKTWEDDVKKDLDSRQMMTDISLVAALLSAGGLSVALYFHHENFVKTGQAAPVSLLFPSCDGKGCMLSFTLSF